MPGFDVLRPETLEEAVRVLSAHGEAARPLAGGTDLLVAIKLGTASPRYLVNLKGLAALKGIALEEGRGVRIGALTRIRDVATSSVIREHVPLLSQSAAELGSVQVRNLATLGGNLCNASPSADTAPALLALAAEVRLVGLEGERVLPLEEFFRGPGETVLGRGELLTEVWVPLLPAGCAGWYVKRGIRRSMDCAIVGVAVVLELDETLARCRQARVALGAVAPTPVRARLAEQVLRGQTLLNNEYHDDLLLQAGEAAALEARPIDDVRASAAYRRDMVRLLVPRAIRQALAAASGGRKASG